MAKRMTVKEKERVARILALLDKEYGTDYRCYLEHDSAWAAFDRNDVKCTMYRCQSQYCYKGSFCEISFDRGICKS